MDAKWWRRRELFRFADPAVERAYDERGAAKFGWMATAMAVFAFLAFFNYGLFDADSTALEQLRAVRFGIFLPAFALMALVGTVPQLRAYWQWQVLLTVQIAHVGVVVVGALYQDTSPYGLDTSSHALNLMVLLVSAVILPLDAAKATFVAVSVAVTYALTSILLVPEMDKELFGNLFNVTYISVCCLLLALWRDATFRAMFRERTLLSVILSEIVPTEVAISIKQGRKVPPKAFGEVAVLFADLAGFTSLSTRIGPKHLVEILDRLFTRFDDLVEDLGLEKVKTIGDAYMVVGGATRDNDEAVVDTVELGWRMIRETERIAAETGLPLQMRIGVHVGSVIGGVIGRTRMAFDYWGDAVNLASRLESSGVPGQVQVSEAAYLRLNGRYALDSQRTLSLKGKGEVACYLLAPPGKADDSQGESTRIDRSLAK